MVRCLIIAAIAVLMCESTSIAAVQTKTVTYKHGAQEFKGFLAWDDASTEKRPGILVVHEWWGLNEYARERAKELAAEGYIAFAADMYGDGKTAEHPQEAQKMAGMVRQNVDEWVKRATAALDVLKSQPQCDSSKLASIGYCFGGSTALQLAFSGADLKAVASFHGALPVPTADQVKKTKATILVCHGAQDSFIPEETIQQFRAALDAGGADWEMDYYAGAQHSFTVISADALGLKGMKYDAEADKRSWARLQGLLKEKFSR
ncbi:Carboxymethylenebutenolidase [Caulifigura coniformis]|uniref:Carboxymethylenebutenolidase n=1 Tax=Caulifigura coniformis TaxID=2527983 RepID=A0A517SG05_9PLAN|nr:dienelactone hydrolase family protein [Caulifigura coniformis]QDT55066.1 Carboxymethylenebutenolidase [Caulifigura coniformis]